MERREVESGGEQVYSLPCLVQRWGVRAREELVGKPSPFALLWRGGKNSLTIQIVEDRSTVPVPTLSPTWMMATQRKCKVARCSTQRLVTPEDHITWETGIHERMKVSNTKNYFATISISQGWTIQTRGHHSLLVPVGSGREMTRSHKDCFIQKLVISTSM